VSIFIRRKKVLEGENRSHVHFQAPNFTHFNVSGGRQVSCHY